MRYQRKDLVAEQIGGELVIFDHKTSRIIRLNDTASFVWKLLKRPLAVSEIVKRVNSTYSIAGTQDIKTLLKTLLKEKILDTFR